MLDIFCLYMLKYVYNFDGDIMKKKLIGFLMCFMLVCMSLLAGCSIVEADYDKYYNQVVSVVVNKENEDIRAEITKRDLISAYQSYGYSYEQYYGMTRSEAIDMTLELLQGRKITLLTAENEFGVSEQGRYGLSEKEQTYLYQQVVDSLNSNLTTYYEDITGTSDEEESDEITFEGYTKTAKLVPVNGSYAIEKLASSEDPLASFTYKNAKNYFDSEDYALIYSNFRDFVLSANQDYKDAFKEYTRQLRISEYGLGLSQDTPSLFDREIQRLYTVAYENYMIQKYSYSNRNLNEISSVTVSDILNRYSSLVRSSYTQYVIEQDESYDDNMQSSLNDIYYYRTDSDATKFFTVANILFMFDEDQQAEYEALTASNTNDGGMSNAEYQQKLDALYASIKPVVRVYNEELDIYEEMESDKTVADVCKEIYQALYNAQINGSVNEIGDVINDFIYRYNEDTGMFNADSNYVIGIDSEGEVVSSFVDSFNTASVELYDGGTGKFGDSVLTGNSNDYTEGLVRSEYGLHLIIYTGACENLFDSLSVSDEQAIEKLNNTRVNPLVDKTYFDVLYDEIYQDNYSYYESINLEYLKENYNITIYRGRYSDLIG